MIRFEKKQVRMSASLEDVAIAVVVVDDDDDDDDGLSSNSSSSSSAVGHLMNDTAAIITTKRNRHNNDPSLQAAYNSIRHASMQAILSSILVYTITAIGVSLNTRGLDPKVIAILIGASQFMTASMVFIVSAKVPQWIGFYHQGAIRLVKCSSNYSQHFEHINLHDNTNLQKLRSKVRLGVWFHFSKFYIILMPFYCGVQTATIPLSIVCGVVFGFMMMWAVFVVHAKYIHRRNIVSFATIFLLSIISALTFTRGMAWIQVVWKWNILMNEDLLLVISFFTWLGLLVVVHALFIWHTLRTEESNSNSENNGNNEMEQEEGAADSDGNDNAGDNTNKSMKSPIARRASTSSQLGNNPTMRRNSSYSSFVFDPRTHFVDGKCQFSDHPDLEDDESMDSAPIMLDSVVIGGNQSPVGGFVDGKGMDQEEDDDDLDYFIESPGDNSVTGFDQDEIDNNACYPNNNTVGDGIKNSNETNTPSSQDGTTKRKWCCRPACCEVFICFSPEYKQSSCFWKVICWIKIIVITLAYLLCLYFVIVSICATDQIASTRANLPAVQEELYDRINEGPVCAFDNRGPSSNITTFKDMDAAHDAGFLIVHCGACGACSSWADLEKEYTTRDNMASLASECAKKSLFGGDDALTECLMEPEIGFGEECAICWMEDIICTKDHCMFIFLQSQMINNVGNFAVGENEITSASCEEAHCEVGQFVPCSGATRRRMNITSSISRPGDQQCAIVDVQDWEDLFFGSGVA